MIMNIIKTWDNLAGMNVDEILYRVKYCFGSATHKGFKIVLAGHLHHGTLKTNLDVFIIYVDLVCPISKLNFIVIFCKVMIKSK